LELIGQKEPISIFEVEREAIRRYADAIDDSNPLYYEEEYAKKTKYGTIIAPPAFITSQWFLNRPQKWPKRTDEKDVVPFPRLRAILADAGFMRLLDLGQEIEFFKTVKAGDTITLETRIKDITIKEGQSGKTARVLLELTYLNQNKEKAAVVYWKLSF
jgi:acyl dehydratase